MTTTNLAAEDLAYIEDHIKSQLGEWLAEQSLGKPPVVYEIELRERMVRIEEELKNQRELIKTVLEQMDKHFGATEKRFEAMQQSMDKRFESMDKRFEAVQQSMDKRFEAVQQSMDKRFESMDKRMDRRFESMQQSMDRRFEELTRRIDRFMAWSFATTLAVGSLVVATLKLWP